VESTGRPLVMEQALASVRPRGGAAAVVGNAREGEALTLNPRQLNLGKRLLGTWGGDSEPDRDFPIYGRLLATGRLDFSPLFSAEYPLDEINRALADLEAGRAARPLVTMAAC
jgi:S-(hydroxymethyl)glutathione dehydrogenase/alcohol dehydrogenase